MYIANNRSPVAPLPIGRLDVITSPERFSPMIYNSVSNMKQHLFSYSTVNHNKGHILTLTYISKQEEH